MILTETETLKARAAFVAKVKKDEEHKDMWAKTSLRAHYAGALRGFASDGVQFRWNDFLAGWEAAKGDKTC